MTLSSMTGFARAAGASPPWRWTWEIKSVNSKGLDLRLRLPPGFDAIEAECRARLSKRLARGAVYATLNAQRESANAEIRVNEQALAGLIAAIERLDLPSGLRPASVDGLLAVRGIVETVEGGDDEAAMAATQAAALAGLDEALGPSRRHARRRGRGAGAGARGAPRSHRRADARRRRLPGAPARGRSRPARTIHRRAWRRPQSRSRATASGSPAARCEEPMCAKRLTGWSPISTRRAISSPSPARSAVASIFSRRKWRARPIHCAPNPTIRR
jgi:hypothetical protein